jgi:hypothetical protein
VSLWHFYDGILVFAMAGRDYSPVLERSEVDKVRYGEGFLQVLRYSPVSVSRTIHHIRWLIQISTTLYNLGIGSVFKLCTPKCYFPFPLFFFFYFFSGLAANLRTPFHYAEPELKVLVFPGFNLLKPAGYLMHHQFNLSAPEFYI